MVHKYYNDCAVSDIHEALVNPGPDLVVCDEGHRIKNSHAGISVSLKQIRTKYVITYHHSHVVNLFVKTNSIL